MKLLFSTLLVVGLATAAALGGENGMPATMARVPLAGIRWVAESASVATSTRTPRWACASRERLELARQTARLRGDRPREELFGRTAIVVDDGLATGATARAACAIARREGASRVLLAVLAAPAGWQEWMAEVTDEYIALGDVYFDQTRFTDAVAAYELAQQRLLDRVPDGGVRYRVCVPGQEDAAVDPGHGRLRRRRLVYE